jgi:hypothetical protein
MRRNAAGQHGPETVCRRGRLTSTRHTVGSYAVLEEGEENDTSAAGSRAPFPATLRDVI